MKSTLLLIVFSSWTCAFTPRYSSSALHKSTPFSTIQLNAVDLDAASDARIAFFIWFFGASGGAGIARGAFPRMFKNVMEIKSLKGVGPTRGGQTVGVSPICGYPNDISAADIEFIVNKNASVEEIVEKHPVEGNFLSKSGYLTYEAFKQANEDANPLAVRAVFDALDTSSDVCNPKVAQDVINELKEAPESVASRVLLAKLKGYSAIFFLLFLLALADYEAFFVHARIGWFPEWPGLDNLPQSLFDPDIGITAIPKYWLDSTDN